MLLNILNNIIFKMYKHTKYPNAYTMFNGIQSFYTYINLSPQVKNRSH